jgi:NDP-sugar pyrophosphorylase family protein
MTKNREGYVGVILAAGKGERLFPLTTTIPKPLLPFAGIEVISYAGYALRQAGVERLLINVHHLGEQLIAYGKNNPFGFRFTVSDERAELLGTGGALAAMRELRDGCGIVAMNGDIITDFPVGALMDFHEATGAAATLALLAKPNPPEQNVWCHQGRIVALGGEVPPVAGATAHGFACIQVLGEEFLELLPEKKSYGIMEIYRIAIARGMHIAGFSSEAFWYDIGTPQAYLQAHRALLSWWAKKPFTPSYDPLGVIALQDICGKRMQFLPSQLGGPSLLAANYSLPEDTVLGPFVVIDENCAVAKGVRLAEAVLLSNCKVEAGQTVVRAILAPDCVVSC